MLKYLLVFFMEKLFKIKERGSSFWTELLGGLVIFISMIYVCSANADILNDIGMSKEGTFAITALLSALCCFLMGFIANCPIGLSCAMGMNSFIAYTIGQSMGFSWQECMVILFTAGIIYFIFSLTPVRSIIINKIPKNLKLVISAGLGAFICFVGLNGGGHGIVNLEGSIPSLGSLSDISILIPLLGVLIIVALMFFKKVPLISKLAIPIGVIVCAILSVSINYGCYNGQNEYLASIQGNFGLNTSEIKNVIFFGLISDNPVDVGTMLSNVFSNPSAYIAIFSLIFLNLFVSTATLLSVGKDCGLMNEQGELINPKRVVIVDATGSFICGPFGTATVTVLAESSTGISLGARTGLTTVVVGLLFLLTSFMYPVFSIFSSWSVTAPALICVGASIFAGNLKDLDWSDYRNGIVAFFTIIFMLLTYSLSTGLGIGIILYVIINLVSGRYKENNVILYIISVLYILAFTLTEVVKYI